MKLKERIKQEILKKCAQVTPLTFYYWYQHPAYNPWSSDDDAKRIMELLSKPVSNRTKYVNYAVDKARLTNERNPRVPFASTSLAGAYKQLGISPEVIEQRVRNIANILNLDPSRIHSKVPIYLSALMRLLTQTQGSYNPKLHSIVLDIHSKPPVLLHELVHSLQRSKDLPELTKKIINAVNWQKVAEQYKQILRKYGIPDSEIESTVAADTKYLKQPQEFFNNIATFTRMFVVDNKRFPKNINELKDYINKNYGKLRDTDKYKALIFMNLYYSKDKEIRKLFEYIVNNLVTNDRQKLEQIRRIV